MKISVKLYMIVHLFHFSTQKLPLIGNSVILSLLTLALRNMLLIVYKHLTYRFSISTAFYKLADSVGEIVLKNGNKSLMT